jgi:outer membrane receptor protein involved in Fe transport
MDDSITIRLSVLNLFEASTPVATFAGTGTGNGNTYPTMYETGTTYFMGLKYNW